MSDVLVCKLQTHADIYGNTFFLLAVNYGLEVVFRSLGLIIFFDFYHSLG